MLNDILFNCVFKHRSLNVLTDCPTFFVSLLLSLGMLQTDHKNRYNVSHDFNYGNTVLLTFKVCGSRVDIYGKIKNGGL